MSFVFSASQGSTKGIVIGTRSGDLYESSLESNGKERPFSLVYSLDRRQQGAGAGRDGGMAHSPQGALCMVQGGG